MILKWSKGLLVVVFLLFASSACLQLLPDYTWHDQQRIAQLLMLVAGTAYFSAAPPAKAFNLIWLVLFALAIGLISVCFAKYTYWALLEWAMHAALLFSALVCADLLKKETEQRKVFMLATLIGGFLLLPFYIGYGASFISGIGMRDPFLLFGGFSNPRFLGQFQTLLLPLLTALVLQYRLVRPALAILVFIIMIGQWCMIIALAGRGVLLALFVAHLSLLWVGREFYRFVVLQIIAAFLGWLLYFMLFDLASVEMPYGTVWRLDLSLRDVVWLDAWNMLLAHPWLGVGPMHFSAQLNPVAAHPHQLFLQWAAEWGVPATLVAAGLIFLGLLVGFIRLKRSAVNELDAALFAALVGLLVLAQVDGVMVMPYTLGWLAVLLGIAIARWSVGHQLSLSLREVSRLMASLSFLVLCSVLLFDAPKLPILLQEIYDQHAIAGDTRFWSQGWIELFE